MMLCPKRRDAQKMPQEPHEFELNIIRNDPVRLKEIRSRLSDIWWWMRLLSQEIGKRANEDDKEVGNLWQARYRAVRLLDPGRNNRCQAKNRSGVIKQQTSGSCRKVTDLLA